jgi:hypothetical protein
MPPRRIAVSAFTTLFLISSSLQIRRGEKKGGRKNLARVCGGGEMSFPESNRKEEQQPADWDQIVPYLLEVGLGDLVLVEATL